MLLTETLHITHRNTYIDIYSIYIYICVCVCVSFVFEFYNNTSIEVNLCPGELNLNYSFWRYPDPVSTFSELDPAV